ncbi:MAG: hypothetical protein ABW360_05930 [Phenylobacterium sp.]
MSEHIDETRPADTNGELVHWMERKPVALGPAGISAAAISAFALGALVTLGALALMHLVGPDRD